MNWLQRRSRDIAFALLKRSGPSGVVSWETWTEAAGMLSGDVRRGAQNAYAEAVWFFACVKAKAEFAGQVPFELLRVPTGKPIDEAEPLPWAHSANALYRRPNPQSVAANLREGIVAFLEIYGNCYLYKAMRVPMGTTKPETLPMKGEPVELWFMRPDQVEVKKDNRGIIIGYRYASQDITIPANRVVHYRTFNPTDDAIGQSTIKPLTRVLATDILAQMYDEQFMKNGARPPGILSADVILNADVRTRLEEELKKKSGPSGAGKVWILEQGLKYQQMALSQKDMEMPTLREYDRQSIMAATRVTPVLLGLPSANYATAREERRVFTEDVIMPLLNKIGQVDNAFLLPDFGSDIVGQHDYSAIPAIAEDKEVRMRVSTGYIKAGVLSPDEVRESDLGLEARPDGMGGEYQDPQAGGLGSLFGGGEKSRKRGEPVPITYTPAQEIRLAAYERRRGGLEKQLLGYWLAAFDEQEKDALDQVDKLRAKREDVWFDDDFLVASTEKAVKASLAAAAQAGIAHALEPLEWAGISFDLTNPKLQAWLKVNAAKEVRLVADTTTEMLRSRIRDIVAEGVAQGKPTATVARELREGVSEIFTTRRHNAKTIAQTEITKAVETTQQTVWQESGVVEGKEWIASMLDNGRHNEMHGQGADGSVPLDGVFVHPGGEFCDAGTEFERPGGSGLAEQDINCHCDMAPVTSAKAKSDYLQRQLERKLWPATGRGSRECETRENLKGMLGVTGK